MRAGEEILGLAGLVLLICMLTEGTILLLAVFLVVVIILVRAIKAVFRH